MAEPIDYDELSDDPELAFVFLAERFWDDLQQELNRAENNQDTTYALVEYMNNIVGAARALEIEKFKDKKVSRRDYNWEEYSDLSLGVKSYIIEVRIRKSRTTKQYSVRLEAPDKAKIHHFLDRIRELLDVADISDRKRNSLFAKLNAFSADVDRIRTRFENAMLVMMDLTDVVKNGTESLKPITELVQAITGLLGAVKNAEPENGSLPSPQETKRIEPPRTNGAEANDDAAS